jgi:hypothetical protein
MIYTAYFTPPAMVQNESISARLKLLAGAAVIFAVLFLVRLFLRSRQARLSHIPGPWLAKYTNAWRGYRAWRLNHNKEGAKNYQIDMIGQYGDVVRISPRHVLVYDPAAIDTVLGFKQRLDKVCNSSSL